MKSLLMFLPAFCLSYMLSMAGNSLDNFKDKQVKASLKKEQISLDSFKDKHVQSILKKMQEAKTDILKLENLQIDNAQIVYLDGFEKLTNLKTLSLSGNLIKNVGSVAKLDEMKRQNFSNNQIQYANCLLGLKNLEFLNLSHNKLKYAFCCSFESIRVLDLSHNEIQQLIVSDKCDLLESIDLSSNPIKQMSINVPLPSLKKFYAEGTLLSDLSPLLKINSLEVLSVPNCIHLKTIDPLFRENKLGFDCVLPKLKELNISEEFLDNESKALLGKIKAGELKRPFYLNKTFFAGKSSSSTNNHRITI